MGQTCCQICCQVRYKWCVYVSVLLSHFGVSVASLLRLARHLVERKRLTYLLQGVDL